MSQVFPQPSGRSFYENAKTSIKRGGPLTEASEAASKRAKEYQ